MGKERKAMNFCDDCVLWKELSAQLDKNDKEGHCHRHAPSPKFSCLDDIEASEHWRVAWPKTYHDDWCGDWRKNHEV